MLNTLYHIEGYIIAHTHVLDYLDQYVVLKKEEAKKNIDLGLMTLPQYSQEMKDIEVMDNGLKEVVQRFKGVRDNYVEILAQQRMKLNAK